MAVADTKSMARWALFVPLAILFASFLGAAVSPNDASAHGHGSARARSGQRTIVIGFLGGYVSRNSPIRSEVKMAKRLKADYPDTALVETFENRHVDAAYKEILKFISGSDDGKLSEEQKRHARVVIYGHSWGGWATVALARKLDKQGIPVLLTLQIDSVSHWWRDDSVIPANVEKAMNFYQSGGPLKGRKEIRAADVSRTRILGNKAYDYRKHPVKCQGYPFWDRWFAKTHMQIECDPSVWGQVESLIRAELGPPPKQSASN